MQPISVVIITFNEEKNIARCLDSVVDIAEDIVVVDSYSTDRTEEICLRYKKVQFIKHPFEGHIQQKNWAITRAKYPRILSLDADEMLSEDLKNSIQKVKNNWTHDGYYFNRLTNYCGKWIKHGSWYPACKLRLWDSRKGVWHGINPHDQFIMRRGSRTRHIKGDLLHYSYYSINEHITQINKFTDIISYSYYKQNRKSSYLKITFNPFWRFIRDYFLKAGFLDGFYGLIICVNSAHETFLKYSKLRKISKSKEISVSPKIGFFNSTPTWGGGEKWHYDVAQHIFQHKKDVVVFTNVRSDLFFQLCKTQIDTYQIKITNLSFLNIIKMLRLASLFKHLAIDTLIINLSADLKAAGMAAKLAGVKNIIYRRGSAIPIRNTLLNQYLFKNVLTGIVANSEETAKTILARNPNLFDRKKIRVIYNGIDLEKYDLTPFQPIYKRKNGEIILGNAGRLVEQKGQYLLIELAKILLVKEYKFKLLIAGDGRLHSQLKQYAREMKVDKHIIFLGFVDNIKNFTESIDIFLLSSLWEGFGYVLIEAMASKKPIVAFDISSNPELVKNGNNGYLVEPRNLKAFVTYVEKLMEDEPLRLRMANEGRKYLEKKFTLDKTFEEIDRYLTEIGAGCYTETS